jgi:lysophospholipid acyltransferase (LPLAT)-like uncharacterized protein
MKQTGRRVLGTLLGFLVRLWVWTLRVTVTGEGAALLSAREPLVIAFLHGQQMALLGARRAGAAVIVSHSADGDVQAGVMAALGFVVVRGSSSRGGARALAAVTKRLRAGNDAVFAVDGPRGPAGVPKPGAAMAAVATGARLLPVAAAARGRIVLRRSWDAFEIPLPFTRVAIVVGAAVQGTAELGRALASGRALARANLRSRAPAMLEEQSWRAESR